MSSLLAPMPKRKSMLSHNLDEDDQCTDEELEEIRIAMRDAFNPKPDAPSRNTANLLPKDKWQWVLKGVNKQKHALKMLQAMGDDSDISNLAATVISSTVRDVDIQRQLNAMRSMKWGFDVFSIDHQWPLTIIGHDIIIRQKRFHEVHSFSEQKLITFLYRIESEYKKHPNQYHSHYHAADVLVSMNWCIDHSALIQNNLNNFERFAMLIAAIVHDVGHDGRNNQFHIDTKSDLAITYHDVSPLENFHVSTAFRCLYRADSNWTASLSMPLQKEMKRILTDCVLSTDMRHHQTTLNSLSDLLKELKTSNAEKFMGSSFKLDDEQRGLVMHSLLHFADISNPMKPFAVSLKWGLHVYAEFFDQGDEEMKIGLNPSTLCDREKADILKGQIGFSQFIVRPMLDLMLVLFPEFEELQQCIDRNCDIYAQVLGLPDRPPNDLKGLDQFFASFNVTESEFEAPTETSN